MLTQHTLKKHLLTNLAAACPCPPPGTCLATPSLLSPLCMCPPDLPLPLSTSRPWPCEQVQWKLVYVCVVSVCWFSCVFMWVCGCAYVSVCAVCVCVCAVCLFVCVCICVCVCAVCFVCVCVSAEVRVSDALIGEFLICCLFLLFFVQ
jgi:hypothetical protein